jgi:predicted DCC family thiol-disulfide oxidoreductase YuxK
MAENPLLSPPVVIYDGRCGFCRIWIEYWQALTGGRLAYAPSQELGSLYPQIPAKNFSESVQLVMPGGEVTSGARAVFRTLTYAPGMAWLLWVYDRSGLRPVHRGGVPADRRSSHLFLPPDAADVRQACPSVEGG